MAWWAWQRLWEALDDGPGAVFGVIRFYFLLNVVIVPPVYEGACSTPGWVAHVNVTPDMKAGEDSVTTET